MRRAAHHAAAALSRWAPTSTRHHSASPAPVFSEYLEVREYTLKPDAVATFLQLTRETIHLRLRMPFLAMFTTEVGGALTRVTHMYLYPDLVRRDHVRAELAATKEWAVDYLSASRACVSHQASMLVGVPAEAAGAARDLAERSARAGGGRPPPRHLRVQPDDQHAAPRVHPRLGRTRAGGAGGEAGHRGQRVGGPSPRNTSARVAV